MHYPRQLHLQTAYSSLGYPPETFPQAKRASERVLSIPMFPTITAEQVAYVRDSVREIMGEK